MNDILGAGVSGTVYAAKVNGEPAALKVSNNQYAISDLQHELMAYQKLSDIQGDFIPKVLWSGYIDHHFGIALSKCEQDTESSKEEKEAVLSEIQKRGVIHNDVQSNNFVCCPSTGRLFAIDFGHSLFK